MVTSEIINKKQKEYDEHHYPKKSPKDKLDCQICGGCYTRQKKATHDKTKKHQNSLKEIFGVFYQSDDDTDSDCDYSEYE